MRKNTAPRKIDVGMLISYDYEYAPTALRQVYAHADRIVLAIDRNRRTWAGGSYTLEQSFFDAVKQLDVDGKIEIYEDDFYDPTLSPIENDTRERNMLARHMGSDDDRWMIQVDSDEYFVDFGAFVALLRTLEGSRKPLVVWGEWVTLFRRTDDGFLFVENHEKPERVALATNFAHYDRARISYDRRVLQLRTDHLVVHQSWARPEGEIKQKLDNWGHKTDFSTEEYFRFWQSVDRNNAPFLRDFHPFPGHRSIWRTLRFIPGDIDEMIVRLREENHPQKRITPIQKLIAVGRKLNKRLHGRKR
jgi:hypothetical protein